jgi:colanic acid/amylovoran biosynthesis protein
VAWILQNTDARVLLVPHVLAPMGSAESDVDAAQALVRRLDPDGKQPHRIRIGPSHLNEQELKWLISRCDWFCGTRMHATIAALSSGVPTASIVYSDKAAGVFERCGQSAHVIDPRTCTTEAALEQFITSFLGRVQARESLAQALVGVEALLEQQTQSIARFALRNA